MVLGVLLAVILNRSRYEKILVTIFLMPMMMAPVIAGTGLVLSLQLDLRLVPLADAECRHPGRDLDPGLGRHRHVGHRAGRRLAMDAADHADRAGRPQARAARPARGAHGRRRRRIAQLRLDHPAQPLSVSADRDPAALHGQFPLHRRHPDPDRRRGRCHQHPAGLPVRRLLPVLQARPRCRHRADPADRDHCPGAVPGEGLPEPRRPASPHGPERVASSDIVQYRSPCAPSAQC